MTTDGVKSDIHWMNPDVEKVMRYNVRSTTMQILSQEHPELFGDREPAMPCGFVEALHPDIPVIRGLVAFNISRGEGWKGPIRRTYEWDAYRVEARYVLQDNPEHEKAFPKFNLKQLGPILIEKLNSPCDRLRTMARFGREYHATYYQTPP